MKYRNLIALLSSICLAGAAALIASCSNSTEASPRPGVHLVAGASGVDTVDATLSAPLIVEYRDSTGVALANQRLFCVFGGTQLPDQTFSPATLFLTSNGVTSGTSNFLIGSSDANGRLVIQVKLGSIAGQVELHYGASGTALVSETALYTVRAGAPARVTMQPRDTGAYPAGRVPLRLVFGDRYKNSTSGTIPIAFVANSDLFVASNGVVTPRLPGRDTIIARVGAFADTVFVTVFPTTGTLLGSVATSGVQSAGLGVMNLDGSGYREIARNIPRPQPYYLYRPKFMIDGKALIVRVAQDSASRMWVVPIDGSAPHIFLKTSISTNEDMQAPSPDGKFIYFSANGFASQLRANVDGTGVVPVAAEIPGPAPSAGDPAISSDGVWMAYKYDGNLRTRNIATGVRTAFNPREGFYPAWAPTGTRFAWTNGMGGTLFTSEYDGSETRVISTDQWLGPLSWTTDGKFILGYHIINATLIRPDLIDVATGAIYPIPFKLLQELVLQPAGK